MGFPKAGLLVGNGPVTNADIEIIRRAELDALKLRAIVNPASDLAIFRDLGIHSFLVQLLSPEPGEHPTTPQAFVDYFAPSVERFVRAGVRDFEIHGEPNRADGGYGVSWDSAAAFGAWFADIADTLRATFGPQLRAGFPGLTPPPPCQAGVSPSVPESSFLGQSTAAIQEADFVCCHIHWNTPAELRNMNGGMRFIGKYLERFPSKPLIISEFSNLDESTSGADKGRQYAEFYLTCAQYDGCHQDWPGNPVDWPRLQAAYAFILRSPDPVYASQVWLDSSGQPRGVAAGVAARARMPDPAALRPAWPTEYRHYTQYYGENQEWYHDISNSLNGGHNGADLHVDTVNPASSPIRSCLNGTVTRKVISNEGYGNHAYVTSQVENVGPVTMLYGHMTHVSVEKGDTVQAGQAIGSAGSTGASTAPHLHLSLKIEGLNIPSNGNHLNPRPYLDPPPPSRGLPRSPYARTYVLLPPDAGSAWAREVIEATWNSQRFTVGGSADDAGIGDLDRRRVVAVNPAAWTDDLEAFFESHYPGVIYVPVTAGAPADLEGELDMLPGLPLVSPPQPSPRGLPRVPYARTYVLLPPGADSAWAQAVVAAAWDTNRFTIGGSADDAGIGDLDFRRVIAVNPAAWGDDLHAFFETHYAGTLYVPLVADSPQELQERLAGEW
jgi:hypothetical protein